MSKSVTPGRLLKWAALLAVAWVTLAVIFSLAFGSNAKVSSISGWIFLVAVVSLLLIAGVSKAVQIGVRTGRD